MKKLYIIFLISFVCIFGIFSKGFEVNTGISSTYNGNYNDFIESKEVKLGDVSFGADVDVKVLLFDIQGSALYSNVSKEHVLNGILSASLALDIFCIRGALGIGYDYYYNITTGAWMVAGKNTFEDFLESPMYLRSATEVLLGDIHLGAFATYPTGVSVSKFFTLY